MVPISKEVLDRLGRISALRALFYVVFDWAIIFLLIWWVMEAQSLVVSGIAFVLIARQQHALGVLMHDAAHHRFLGFNRANDVLAQLLLASPVLVSLSGYRFLHLLHHRGPLSDLDPDRQVNGGYPRARSSWFRKLVRDFLGLTFFRAVPYYLHVPKRPSGIWIVDHPKVTTAIVQLLFFGGFWAAGYPLYYLYFWLLPLITVLQVFYRIRTVAEHSGYEPDRDQRLCTRTVAPSWQTWLFAPHHVHYHVEHHLFTRVPHYRLPQLHREFMRLSCIPESNFATDYSQIYRELILPNR